MRKFHFKRQARIGDWACLFQGDCLETLEDAGKFDVVVTDPPYSSGARRDADRQVRGPMMRMVESDDWFSHDEMTTWGFSWFLRSVFLGIRPRMKPGGHVYVFTDWRQTPNVYAILESAGFRVNHCLVWRKTTFGMGAYWRNQHENVVFASAGQPAPMLDRGRGSVLECQNVTPAKRVHPTEKPVALMQQIISAVPGQTILDPFMGSGSTGEACGNLGRNFVGIEVDGAYFDVAAERLRRFHKQPSLMPWATLAAADLPFGDTGNGNKE